MKIVEELNHRKDARAGLALVFFWPANSALGNASFTTA
jgi:hypothetical protein